MTTGQFLDLDRRVSDFNSQQAAAQKNAAMRGDPPYTTQPRTPAETAGFVDHNPPADPEPAKPDDIDEILRKHLRVTGENIRLREELAQARKARDAAQELLEAERQKCAKIETDAAAQAYQMQSSLSDAKGEVHRVRHDLDTEKLLRANDTSTIADLQRRLREAEGQLKAQRDARKYPVSADVYEISGRPAVTSRGALIAENTELRRTLGIVGKYLAELTELVSDPADEKRKEPKP